jgi:hypothetical protein
MAGTANAVIHLIIGTRSGTIGSAKSAAPARFLGDRATVLL